MGLTEAFFELLGPQFFSSLSLDFSAATKNLDRRYVKFPTIVVKENRRSRLTLLPESRSRESRVTVMLPKLFQSGRQTLYYVVSSELSTWSLFLYFFSRDRNWSKSWKKMLFFVVLCLLTALVFPPLRFLDPLLDPNEDNFFFQRFFFFILQVFRP